MIGNESAPERIEGYKCAAAVVLDVPGITIILKQCYKRDEGYVVYDRLFAEWLRR